MPPSEASPYRLIVEGSDDLHSIANLMMRHGTNWDAIGAKLPFIESVGGINELLKAAPVAVKGSYERIGMVLDADVNPSDRWESLCRHLLEIGLQLPDQPAAEGTIVAGLRPTSTVGVWVMPDNGTPGRLEEFLEKLVPRRDPCWDFAVEMTKQTKARGCNTADELKSSLHAWLAWQAEPGLPFGTALRARLFRDDSPEALRFVAWFNRLFA